MCRVALVGVSSKMGNSKSAHHNNNNNTLILREMPQKVRELHFAVMTNDLDAVRHLLDQGVNINFPWYNPSSPSVKDGSTPLIIAVSLNYTNIVDLLLGSGAYINKCDRNGCTPVYKAAFHGRPTLIEVLAKAGADVNLSDFMGKTPLYICVNNAIVHSCKSAIQKLIKGGAIVDKKDRSGQAPIHVAAHWKLRDILGLLIKAHSNVNIVDNSGRTPLYICVSSLSTRLYNEDILHQLPCILMLFHSGADMLNLIEWIHFKGSGIPNNLLHKYSYLDIAEFERWYEREKRQPQKLKNMCRKVIQMQICRTGRGANLVKIGQKLPVPPALRTYLQRKVFYREEWTYYNNGPP